MVSRVVTDSTVHASPVASPTHSITLGGATGDVGPPIVSPRPTSLRPRVLSARTRPVPNTASGPCLTRHRALA
eukprot:3565634-Prymnesium_polylepis.1